MRSLSHHSPFLAPPKNNVAMIHLDLQTRLAERQEAHDLSLARAERFLHRLHAISFACLSSLPNGVMDDRSLLVEACALANVAFFAALPLTRTLAIEMAARRCAPWERDAVKDTIKYAIRARIHDLDGELATRDDWEDWICSGDVDAQRRGPFRAAHGASR